MCPLNAALLEWALDYLLDHRWPFKDHIAGESIFFITQETSITNKLSYDLWISTWFLLGLCWLVLSRSYTCRHSLCKFISLISLSCSECHASLWTLFTSGFYTLSVPSLQWSLSIKECDTYCLLTAKKPIISDFFEFGSGMSLCMNYLLLQKEASMIVILRCTNL